MNKIVNLIRYIGKYFNNKQKTRLYLTILVCVLSSIINSISPVVLSKLIDQLNYVLHSEKFYELIFYSIIYILILILGRLLPILSNITLMFSQIDRKLVLLHSFMTYLYCQNESFFEKNNAGSVSQRAVQLNNECIFYLIPLLLGYVILYVG